MGVVAGTDDSRAKSLIAYSNAADGTFVQLWADPVTHRLLVDSSGSGGGGTVTSVSVVSANGFAGTVATATTTPAITISTTITGVLIGNGTTIAAATTTGSGSVVLATAPTITGATLTTTSVNGVTLTTGGGTATFLNANGAYSTPSASATSVTVGTTTVLSGTTTRVLFDNAGVLGEYTISGSGNVAMTTSPSFTTPTLGVASATSLATSAASPLLLTNGQLATIALTSQTVGGTTLTIPNFASVSDTFAFIGLAQTLTNKTLTSPTLTTPVINGTATGTGVSATPTASIIAMWDANKNLSANAFIAGFTTTATAAGTTTLTIASAETQVFTGSTTQTVKLPTTSVAQGAQYTIVNQSTGLVTVQSSGANTITILGAGTSAQFTAVTATPTTAANWNSQYLGVVVASGKVGTINNSIIIAGTDATTMTFPSTSATIARTDAGQTFTGTNAFGVITATTLNGNTFTTGTYTLTGGASKTLTFNNSITLAGTDSTTMTFPSTSATIARTDAAQTFTGTQTFSQIVTTANAVTAVANAATVPITSRITNVTNNSAATLTITLTTASAVDGQLVMVRVFDFSAVAQTITWVNTENSTATVPTTSNGSTTLPLTVGFQFNSATTKWRCIAVA